MRVCHYWVAAFLLMAGQAACSSGSDASGPTPIDLSQARISAVSPTTIFGLVGSDATELPAIVIKQPDDKPVAGVTVTFSIAGTQSRSVTAVTGDDGIARMKALKIDAAPGQYEVLAQALGTAAVKFTTVALPQAPVAVYDLQSWYGMTVPFTVPDDQYGLFTMSTGYYVLLDDGSYVYGSDTNVWQRFASQQKLIRLDAQTVAFYAVSSNGPPPVGFPDKSYLRSTGTFVGNILDVEYPPLHDGPPDEVYVLRH
jgi:hypothetical protein